MATLSIKNVPADVVEKLRRRAARNHRSMQGELLALVSAAAADTDEGSRKDAMAAQKQGTKTIEEIMEAQRKRFPEPITVGPLSVDMIRADRDAR